MNSDDEKYSDVEDNESIDSEPQPKKVFNKSSKNNDSDVEDNDDVIDKYEHDGVIVNDNNSDDEEVDDDDDDDDEQEDENISSNGIAKLKGNNKQLGNSSNINDINKNVILDDNNLNEEDYNNDYDNDDDDDDDDDDDNDYLNLLEDNISNNYIKNHHPECLSHNFNEVEKMCSIVRDKHGNIIDPLHKTTPILTKYERTRIIGQRCKQLNDGSKPFISLPYDIVDMHIIAELELEQKKIPFIIKRPIPNGGFEYWRLNDLEILSF